MPGHVITSLPRRVARIRNRATRSLLNRVSSTGLWRAAASPFPRREMCARRKFCGGRRNIVEYRSERELLENIGLNELSWNYVALREVRHEGWFLPSLLFFSRIWREGFREGRGGRAILPGRPFLLIISYVSDDVETNYCASFRSPGGAFVARRCCLPLPSLSLPPSFLPSFLSLFLIHYHYPEETYSRETRLTLVALQQSSLE